MKHSNYERKGGGRAYMLSDTSHQKFCKKNYVYILQII